MNFTSCRLCAPLLLAFFLLLAAQNAFGQARPQGAAEPPPAVPNRLVNAEFECGAGGYFSQTVPPRTPPREIDPNLIPNGWAMTHTQEVPGLSSARIFFEHERDSSNGGCDTREAHVEKIGGDDSFYVRALDLETPPEPGKPFDVALLQQVEAVSGTAYSLSGWAVSLCGGSFVPSDCPSETYIAKMLGIDPTGGGDPWAGSVVWAEDRRNFWQPDVGRVGWVNLRVAATAQAPTVTVFARLDSPFQHHGNHGFIDALSLVQAPTATLTIVTPTAEISTAVNAPYTATLTWDGALGPDIPTIAEGNYELLFDLEYWHPENDEWRPVAAGVEGAGSTVFQARCTGTTYQFRVRARAEQPEGERGVWPNQRYPGVWSPVVELSVPPAVVPPMPDDLTVSIFLPAILAPGGC